MKHHHHLPKAEWGPGPWQEEPDFVRFIHAGLECAIVRNTWVTGSLNGYVAVPPSHPWWGKGYAECVATPQCEPEIVTESILERFLGEPRWHCAHTPDGLIEVHGGITFAGPPFWPPELGAPDEMTWGFGFDTGHAWDLAPMMQATLRNLYHEADPTGSSWRDREETMGCLFGTPYDTTYKDLAYVRSEAERMAEQIALASMGVGWGDHATGGNE